ncbi:MAG TPA: LysM peptidoglycan-binding domain-containing protein [Bacillota bacterium]|nr:LysM peptidoglycan-binding domain-containing protein [Bacillota bacterium]
MIYVIQPGDTLYTIARRFNTTINALLVANRQITNPNLITAGQTIIIPENDSPTTNCPLLRQGDRGPSVRRLQTLLRIAGFDPGPIDGIYGARTQTALLAFQRSIREIEVSGVADIETWTALGAECEVAPGIIKYTVRPGDSLYIIATRFNVTVSQILRANPQIADPGLIFAGQVINIPTV